MTSIAIIRSSVGDMHALLRAYKIYSASIEHLPSSTPLEKSIRAAKFSLANSWILANELRSGVAMYDKCKTCQTYYFLTQLQQVECSCPFCKQRDAYAEKRTKAKANQAPSTDSQPAPEIGMAAE